MRILAFALVTALALPVGGCFIQRRDPALDAAQEFEGAVYDWVDGEAAKRDRLSRLLLGMSPAEVIETAGPPDTRTGRRYSADRAAEIWRYRGSFRILAVLEFEDGRLVAVDVP